jgi:glycerophosphoryl diester phosphodiesterase
MVAFAGVAAPMLVDAPSLARAAFAEPEAARRRQRRPLVIGHRGAAGYRPEHTLASYELAARMGADFIEPDLVTTKDHVLVARHEPELGGTTDVATRPEFASRKTTKVLDGVPTTGWFTEDLTLGELKTLRAVERFPQVRQHNTLYNGLFQIPTFEEILDLRVRLSRELGRQVAPVFVQSFEAGNLRTLHDQYRLRAPKVFLTCATGHPFNDPRSYADYLTPSGLRELSTFTDGIGPDKDQIIPRLADGTLGTGSTLVPDAHSAGLVVHPYTFRAENRYLPVEDRVTADPTAYGRAIDEQLAFLRAGIDGLFTDQPDVGVLSRQLYLTS